MNDDSLTNTPTPPASPILPNLPPRSPRAENNHPTHPLVRSLMRLAFGVCLALVIGFAMHLMGYEFKLAVTGVIVVFLTHLLFLGRVFVPEPKTPPSVALASPHNQIMAPQADAFREVIETVVFVVVLVLLLKSFAAEAFIIPTGSMAETLWGYNKVVTCPSCQYQYPVSCNTQVEPQDGARSLPVFASTCPNCRKHVNLVAPPSAVVKDSMDEIRDPGWNSGDKVLVAKFLYDMLNRLPNRLDVVVFKFPGDAQNERWPSSGPHNKNYVPLNYIKRLIGLPGETIAICGGKIYVLSAEAGPHYPEDLQDANGNELAGEARLDRLSELWRKDYMHLDRAVDQFRLGRFVIMRKSPEVMLAVRRVVFDNDHQPKDEEALKLPPRWSGDGWVPEGTTFHGQAHADFSWLTYRHIVRDKGKEPTLISDFLGYNSYENSEHPFRSTENWVGDLMVECEAAVEKGEGELVLELGRGVDRFQARFDLTSGICTLWRKTSGTPEKLGEGKPTGVKAGGTYRLRFANVDQKLTLWVNDSLPFGRDGVTYEAPKGDERGPRKDDLEPVKIGAKGSNVTIRKLKLFRDTYYTQYTSATNQDVHVNLSEPSEWDRLKDMPVSTYYVQPNHFLCLGDNSPESSDGRAWGLVPERLLLGRALVVYWPIYFPLYPLNSQVNRVGLIK